MSEKQKSFVKGAAILSIAGLICRALGAVYRIPLTYILGSEGMAYYQYAYPVYNFLLVISSAGLPSAISKLVSAHIAKGDPAAGYRIFKTSWKILLVIGLATSAIMLGGSGLLAQMVGAPDARFSYMAIAPALFFVSLISAYRGYFQGQQRMTPTAVSQIIEQVGKLLVGFFLSQLFMSMMFEQAREIAVQQGIANVEEYARASALPYGAAGALLGVSVSELFAMLFMMVIYKAKGNTARIRNKRPLENMGGTMDVVKTILKVAIPITIGASIMPLASSIDSAMITRRLMAGGFEDVLARDMFGLLTGYILSIINMPAVITASLSMALVPAISAAHARRDKPKLKVTVQQGLKLAFLIGLPCFTGICALGTPIVHFLYAGSIGNTTALDPNIALELAGNLLSCMSVSVFLLAIVQTTNGMLQGYGKTGIPVRSMFCGALTKVALNYVLISLPSINIYGAAISSAACYLVALLMNLHSLKRYSKQSPHPVHTILKPAIAALTMGGVVYALRLVLMADGYSRAKTILVIAAGIFVYALMLLLTRTITPADMQTMPGGRKIAKLLKKLRIWK